MEPDPYPRAPQPVEILLTHPCLADPSSLIALRTDFHLFAAQQQQQWLFKYVYNVLLAQAGEMESFDTSMETDSAY